MRRCWQTGGPRGQAGVWSYVSEQPSAWNLLWLLAPFLGVTAAAVTLARLSTREGPPLTRGSRVRVVILAGIVFGGVWVGLGQFAEAEVSRSIRFSDPGLPTLHFDIQRFLLVQAAVVLVVAVTAARLLARDLLNPAAGQRKAVLLGLPVAIVAGPLIAVPVAMATFANVNPLTVSDEPQRVTAYVEIDPPGSETTSQLATCLSNSGAKSEGGVQRSGNTYTLHFVANSDQQTALDDCLSDLDGMSSVSYSFGP